MKPSKLQRFKTALRNKRNRVKAISQPYSIFVQQNGERAVIIGGIVPSRQDVDKKILDLFVGSAIRIRGLR